MSKQIIIDWQRDHLLAAIGHLHGGAAVLDRVSSHEIHTPESLAEQSDGTSTKHPSASRALVQAVEELSARKSDVIVVAAREMVEVRTIAVPRIEASELPDVIRFQAQRQLANMGDSWALDYIMLPDQPGQEMQTALVGAIAPATLQEIEAACADAGLQLAHVALRPIEIARFALHSGRLSSTGASLVICLSADQADLLILKQGKMVQLRGTKLPSDASQLGSSLSGELRRSLMAAASQLGHQPLAGVLLLATEQLAAQVQESIAAVVDCPVAVVDPTSLLAKGETLHAELAETSASRLTALAGSLHYTAADASSKLDFKNPKKRPPPKSKSTTYLLVAAAAAVMLLAGVSWWITANRTLDEDLAFYQAEVANKKDLVAVAQTRIADLKEIDSVLKASPNWLDEMAYIAERIPEAEKIILGEPDFSVQTGGVGRIVMPVAADSSASISLFEKTLRDPQHVVEGKDIKQLEQPTNLYKWQVKETISVTGRGWNLVDGLDASRSAVAAAASTSPPAASAGSPAAEASTPPAAAAETQPAETLPAETQPAEPPAAVETSDEAPPGAEPTAPIPDDNKQAQAEPAEKQSA